jgi:hypothetical protein
MAITLGTPTSSGNQANSSSFSFNHTTAANTKCLVVVVTGYDSSATDSVVSGITFNGASYPLQEIARGRYRSGSGFIAIWYLPNPKIGGPWAIAVTMGGACTDVQATAVGLIDATRTAIIYDTANDNTVTSSASHALVVSGVTTGSMGIGGIVDAADTAVTGLSVTASYGTEISGSEADMGSQVVGCAYRLESGGTCEIRWTRTNSATASYAQVATFKGTNSIAVPPLTCSHAKVLAPTIQIPWIVTVPSPFTCSATKVLVPIFQTVVLGANPTGTISDSTPTFYFTGTDTYSADLEYEIQVDTNINAIGNLGFSAIDRSTFTVEGRTYAFPNVSANSAGTVQIVDIYAYSDITGLKIATMYTVSGTTRQARAYTTVGNFSAGYHRITGLNLQCEINDYLAFYIATGTLERDTAGGSCIYRTGDCLDGTSYTISSTDNTPISIISISPSPILDKASDVDTTDFYHDGSDTHPFTSGHEITATISETTPNPTQIISHALGNELQGTGGNPEALGQSFTTSSSTSAISKITLWLVKNNSPTDNIVLSLKSGSMNGTVLGTSTVSATGVPTSPGGEIDFVFSSPINVSPSTMYYLTIERSGSLDTTNYCLVNFSQDSSYPDGRYYYKSGGSWTLGAAYNDLYSKFILYIL